MEQPARAPPNHRLVLVPPGPPAPRLGDTVEAARARLFVGRTAELQHLQSWLDDTAGPTRIFALCGMGGSGKSALMAEMLRRARSQAATTIRVDGHACARSPAGLLDSLRSALSAPQFGDSEDPVARLTAFAFGGRRAVLGIDNYDDLSMLEGWLREEFLGELPDQGILIVLAARQPPSAAWLADPAWRGRVLALPLEPFSRAEASDYLARLGLAELPTHGSLLRAARGHPLSLSVGAALLDRQPSMAPALITQTVGAHLLQEVAAAELHPLLDALAILREADQELLAEVLGEPVGTDAYHALARLSFTQPSNNGVALHDVAQAQLQDDFQQRAPGRHRLLRRRAVAALRARFTATSARAERRRLAVHLLSVCRDALPVHPWYADLSATLGLPAPSSARPEDRQRLHEIFDVWSTQAMQIAELGDEHRLLDALCDRYPESIRVVRSAGEPLAFTAVVPLHRATAALLERHRAGAIYLSRCPAPERAALDCTPQQVDSYYLVLFGTVLNHLGYSADELAGTAIHDWLAYLGQGSRLLGLASNPEITSFTRQIGFRPRPECCAVFGGAPWPFEVGELDLRRRDFGSWVSDFLQMVEQPTATWPEPEPASRRRALTPDAAILTDVRGALAVADYPNRLESSALARRLGVTGRVLRGLLEDSLTSEPPPAPLTPADQAVLRAAYLEKEETPEAAAARLCVSRATFYRRLGDALAALAETLLAG